VTSGSNNLDYFPENQLSTFSASWREAPKSMGPEAMALLAYALTQQNKKSATKIFRRTQYELLAHCTKCDTS